MKNLSTSDDGTIPFGANPATDAGQIVLQLDETGTPTHRYLWGPAVDMLLADEVVDDGGAEDVAWTLTDHQNSVRDIVVLDDNGTPGYAADDEWIVENHITYRAFGEKAAETGAVDCVFGFTGRYLDSLTGDQYNHQRWYKPATGNWQSEDPIGFEGGDANLYRYCGNDPVNWVDPSGLRKNVLKALVKVRNLGNGTAEFVLKNGKVIKIRNAKFIDSTVSLADVAAFTNVAPSRIKEVGKKFGSGVTVRYDKFGQPIFTKQMVKGTVELAELKAGRFVGNYADKAWAKLKLENPKLYSETHGTGQYVWHHVGDGNLQLIDKDLHATFQHTGLNSVLKGQLAGLLLLIPGTEYFKKGDVNGGFRDIVVNFTPLGWSQMIGCGLGAFFDECEREVRNPPPAKHTGPPSPENQRALDRRMRRGGIEPPR